MSRIEKLIIAAIVLVIGGLIIGVILADRHEASDKRHCLADGGRWVEDGPPTYIKVGNVMVPSQSYKCERPR